MRPVQSPPRFCHQNFAMFPLSYLSIIPLPEHSSISFFDAFQSRLQTSYTSHKHVSDLKALQVVTLCSQGCSDPSWEALTASKPQLPLCYGDGDGDEGDDDMTLCLSIPSTKGCNPTGENHLKEAVRARSQAPIPGYSASSQSYNCQIKLNHR